jgi:hypothetical protein
MYLKKITGVGIITDMSILTVAPDGYICLTFEEFRKISLMHLISGLDEDKTVLLQEGATFTEITGYTEWISDTTPAISIGWDWVIQPTQVRGGYYKRASEPRSNLMLVDSQQHDLGPTKTALLIEIVADEIAWQRIVQEYIR